MNIQKLGRRTGRTSLCIKKSTIIFAIKNKKIISFFLQKDCLIVNVASFDAWHKLRASFPYKFIVKCVFFIYYYSISDELNGRWEGPEQVYNRLLCASSTRKLNKEKITRKHVRVFSPETMYSKRERENCANFFQRDRPLIRFSNFEI